MKNRLLFCALLLLLMSWLTSVNRQLQKSADVVKPTVMISSEIKAPEQKAIR